MSHAVVILAFILLIITLIPLARLAFQRRNAAVLQQVPKTVMEFVSEKPADLDTDGKSAALREAYIQLYSQNHYLRDTMLKIITGAVGVLGVSDGWLIAKNAPIPKIMRIVITVADILIGLLAGYTNWTHYREYVANSAMIVRVERALGFYSHGFYTPTDSIYKPNSSRWGEGIYSTHVVVSYLIAIFAVVLFSVSLIWIL